MTVLSKTSGVNGFRSGSLSGSAAPPGARTSSPAAAVVRGSGAGALSLDDCLRDLRLAMVAPNLDSGQMIAGFWHLWQTNRATSSAYRIELFPLCPQEASKKRPRLSAFTHSGLNPIRTKVHPAPGAHAAGMVASISPMRQALPLPPPGAGVADARGGARI